MTKKLPITERPLTGCAPPCQTKATLPTPHKRLIELMQRLNHGRIEGLAILNGAPVFDPPPRVIQDIKLGGENGPRPELMRGDFALRSQVTELFQHLACLGDGVVTVLEVKHGLPFKLVIEQEP